MPTLFQLNTVCNSGSTGRIAEQIGVLALQRGWKSYIAYGHGKPKSQSILYKVTTETEFYVNTAIARLIDNDGFCLGNNTQRLVAYLKAIKPDVIQLHNLHGFYLNIDVLFAYLATLEIPIFWTLHDCWSFTGHCSYFELVGCNKWLTQCHHCPNKTDYPSSWGLDRSRSHYILKKKRFTSLQKLTLITPSEWLATLVKKSYLKGYPVRVIHNGVDLKTFYPRTITKIQTKYGLEGKKVLLGVAAAWSERKGFRYLLEISKHYAKSCKIVLVGLTAAQKRRLPVDICGIERTENVDELAALYTLADVYLNPTLEDTFPTTNLEALACGTPVITFNTGGSGEALDSEQKCGKVIEKRDLPAMYKAIDAVLENDNAMYQSLCVERATTYFQSSSCFATYLQAYTKALGLKA